MNASLGVLAALSLMAISESTIGCGRPDIVTVAYFGVVAVTQPRVEPATLLDVRSVPNSVLAITSSKTNREGPDVHPLVDPTSNLLNNTGVSSKSTIEIPAKLQPGDAPGFNLNTPIPIGGFLPKLR
jgi:hypothetical protein